MEPRRYVPIFHLRRKLGTRWNSSFLLRFRLAPACPGGRLTDEEQTNRPWRRPIYQLHDNPIIKFMPWNAKDLCIIGSNVKFCNRSGKGATLVRATTITEFCFLFTHGEPLHSNGSDASLINCVKALTPSHRSRWSSMQMGNKERHPQ